MKSIWRRRKSIMLNEKYLQLAKTPEVISSGAVLLIDAQTKTTEEHSYKVMPRLGQNLETYYVSCGNKISKSSAYQLGVHIVTMLE